MNHLRKPTGLRTVAMAAALFGVMFFAAATPSAQADARARCRQRIERAEVNLDRAISRHGERSRQAENRRRELIGEREHCWKEFHGWWDGREHRWHEERDWDRR